MRLIGRVLPNLISIGLFLTVAFALFLLARPHYLPLPGSFWNVLGGDGGVYDATAPQDLALRAGTSPLVLVLAAALHGRRVPRVWRYCPRCGSELAQTAEAGSLPRLTCGGCGFVHYPQPKLGAGLLITDDRRVLLLQRGHAPWAGHWNLPAGYVEVGESPEAAALRETREETGFDAAIDGVFGVFPFSDDPRGDGVLLVYRAHLVGGSQVTTPEVRAAGWFDSAEIPAALCGGGHDAAITAWRTERAEHGPNTRRDERTGKPTFTVGAFAVVRDAEGAVLLGRRADRDLWTLPGGAVEHGETPWAAVVRETREETGIEVEPMRLAIVDWKTHLADVVFVFECRMTGGTLATSAETSEVGFFTASAYPATLPKRLVERIEQVLRADPPLRLRETPGLT